MRDEAKGQSLRKNRACMQFCSSALLLGLGLAAAGCGPVSDSPGSEVADDFGSGEMSLRLDGAATASSVERSTLGASNAVDGNLSTRWSSAFSDPQWIRIDLGATKSINRVVLRWEAAYSADYDVQFSNDAVGWTKAYGDAAGNGGVDDIPVSGSARYVRMYSRRRGTPYGNSLYEFEVHAPDTTPPPPPSTLALPAKIQAESPARFFDTTAANLGTAACSSTAVDAQTTTDTGAGCNVGWTEPGEWLEWDVSLATAGNFDLVARLAASTTGKSVRFEIDGARVGTTLTAPASGWQAFADVATPRIAIAAGNHRLRLVTDTGQVNINWLDVRPASTTPTPTNRDVCKRGVAFGRHTASDLTALSKGVTWWYNWAVAPESGAASVYQSVKVEFVPMIWDEHFNGAPNIPSGAKTLLGFNEPNFFSQANLSAQQAASYWPELQDIARARGMKIASPALNYCGPAASCWDTNPFSYFDKFFAACTSCQVDYLAVHWYACDVAALRSYISDMKRYNKPIWLTEFACGDGADRSLAKQKQYMRDAVAYLESEPAVIKYSWFADGNAIPNVALVNGSGLTELGTQYVNEPRNSACLP